MPGVGLMMIVKDEAPVIERCLRSVRSHVDWWIVCDTGSTDGTQDLVRRVMGDRPGALVERPWVSFGHNRQEALDAARALEHSRPDDHALWIDADDVLTDVPATWPSLPADGYYLEIEYADTRFDRLHLVRLDRPWRWAGAVHEHLDLSGATTGRLASPRIVQHHDGARSRDPETYLRDAALLEAELRERPDDPRSQFYLAQSWRDAGRPGEALAAYRLRGANLAGWHQERFYALFQAAVMAERLGAPPAEVADAYLMAYQLEPSRAEPLVDLARFERKRERFEVALLYARAATALPHPGSSALFVDGAAHSWRAWDEVSISCYWTGRYVEGAAAARRAIASGPDEGPEGERLRSNLAWCESRLASAGMAQRTDLRAHIAVPPT